MYQRILILILGAIFAGIATLTYAEDCYKTEYAPSEIMQCMQQRISARDQRLAQRAQTITTLSSAQAQHLQPLLRLINTLQTQIKAQEDRLDKQDQAITATSATHEQRLQPLLESVNVLTTQTQTLAHQLTERQQQIATLTKEEANYARELATLKQAQSVLAQNVTTKHEPETQPAATKPPTPETEVQLIGERYRDNGDGTVTDVQTKLIWKRCSEGQTWAASKTCTGDIKTMTWNEAMPDNKQKTWDAFANHKDWRVPTKEELNSLVYCSSGKPKAWNNTGNSCRGEYQKSTIKQTAFPATPPIAFWSADTLALGYVWHVNFHYGDLGNYGARGDTNAVRLVRNGQ